MTVSSLLVNRHFNSVCAAIGHKREIPLLRSADFVDILKDSFIL